MTTDVINAPRELLRDAMRMLEAHSPGSGSVESYAAQDIQALLTTAQPVIDGDNLIRFDFTNGDGRPDSKMMTHDEMRQRYSELRRILATAQPAADGEREAFEAVYAGRCNFERNPHHPDIYANEPCRARWEAWQARAAQPQQAVAVTDEMRRLREALERVKLTEKEARHHSVSTVAYWNNAVTACISVLAARGGEVGK